MAAGTKWRTWRLGALLFPMLVLVVNGYEETYRISQLSPKSAVDDRSSEEFFQTSRAENLAFRIEPSALYDATDVDEGLRENEDYIARSADPREGAREHYIVARSAEPRDGVRGSRSIRTQAHNEVDADLIHHKRKYYDIHPTKTRDVREELPPSGDRLEFTFPGEERRVPYGRALSMGPRIRPSAVQLSLATAPPEPRQNPEIQNIITGLVKLLNGNVHVQANTLPPRGAPRPLATRINNRGPPRISDVAPPPDDVPGPFVPAKTPPPYPFDRPPVHVNLPEQIVPPFVPRPGLHRPLPPWQRPRPPSRPNPNRRPSPLPVYKPAIVPYDIPEAEDDRPDVSAHENETVHSENVIHHDEPLRPEEPPSLEPITDEPDDPTTETTTSEPTTPAPTTPEPTTTEKPTEKPVKIEKEKKKETPNAEKEKPKEKVEKSTTPVATSERPAEKTTEAKPVEKTTEPKAPEETKTEAPVNDIKAPNASHIDTEDKLHNEIAAAILNQSSVGVVQSSLEPSLVEVAPPALATAPLPPQTPPPQAVPSAQASPINDQPLPSSPPSGIPYQPYRPRPGIVLDDPEFQPHGPRRPPAPAPRPPGPAPRPPRPHNYGEIFDVTVSAIQGPGGKDHPTVEIETVKVGADSDLILTAGAGGDGFVSIDGKRTYLNLFDTAPPHPAPAVAPTPVQRPQPSPPTAAPSLPAPPGPPVTQGAPPGGPSRRPHPHGVPPYRKPQPPIRIDTCIVGDDSTCDRAQNERCRTEAGISSCLCRCGFARARAAAPCRRVVALQLALRVDRLYDRKVAWDPKLADKDSEPYQQLSYEAVRAMESAFSMTPFSDDFVGSSVNALVAGSNAPNAVYVNATVLLQETAETGAPAVGAEIQRQLLGVLRRRHHNVGSSNLYVDAVAGAVLPPQDVEECASPELNDCHPKAVCTNTWGGFRCSCPEGTLDAASGADAGRECRSCPDAHCSGRGLCRYQAGQPTCNCNAGYYGARCEVDGEVVGVAAGASLAAALVIALTLAALLSWSRKWSRSGAGAGSPVFNYAGAAVKSPPVGHPPYQVTLEERMRWAQIAEAMAASHYAGEQQTMATRPSSAMFGAYPPLPPVPMPRMGTMHGTLNTAPRGPQQHLALYGYSGQLASESTSSDTSSHAHELLVPRPKSRARSLHNQSGIYYDVEYENAEPLYGTAGPAGPKPIPLSTYTLSRGPPYYR